MKRKSPPGLSFLYWFALIVILESCSSPEGIHLFDGGFGPRDSAVGTGGGVGTGGNLGTGGALGTGGVVATGGASATGGAMATGGASASGGASATGGAVATGGASTAGTGGSVGSGGATSSGGATGTGGSAGAGGVSGTGGRGTGGSAGATGSGGGVAATGGAGGGNCVTKIITAGYVTAAQTCADCKDNSTPLESKCKLMLDCLEKMWPCTACQTECLNMAGGSAPVATCVDKMTKSSCGQ